MLVKASSMGRMMLGVLVLLAVSLSVHLIPEESLETPLGFTAMYALIVSIIPFLATVG